MKKSCRNCKYAQQTFGIGLTEDLQIWECTALAMIEPPPSRVPITLNHCCMWWNKSKDIITADVKKMKEEFTKRRRMEKGICIGKISDLKYE